MMKEEIDTSDLKKGMYVELGNNWLDHPFLRRSFMIESHTEIEKIQGYLDRVIINLGKSKIKPKRSKRVEEVEIAEESLIEPVIVTSETVSDKGSWEEKNTPSTELKTALNSDLPAEEKAREIFQHSSDLMNSVLSQAPTKELINETSHSIQNLAEFIVADDEVASKLLSITSHDFYTYTHSVNVGIKSLLIAKKILNTHDIQLLKELGVGFFLHDIGKSEIDPGILNKPGKLDDAEMHIMRTHPQRGVDLLRAADSLTTTSQVITLQHHEKIDGSGYPYKLKGKQVHEFAQMCALGDIYDALTSERSYKKGMSIFDALLLMKKQMSHHFDEKLFNSFILLFTEDAKKNS